MSGVGLRCLDKKAEALTNLGSEFGEHEVEGLVFLF